MDPKRSTPHTLALWRRLQAWPQNQPICATGHAPGLGQALRSTLRAQHGWSAAHTERALHEYRRFCYLSQVAGHPVCPSEAIDQVWHAHLLHSRNYWQDFCPHVLGHALHHQPSLGGSAQHAHHHNLYHQTLASYERHFGALPPPDLWPGAAQRFGPPLRMVDARSHWVLPKPRWVQRCAAGAAHMRRLAQARGAQRHAGARADARAGQPVYGLAAWRWLLPAWAAAGLAGCAAVQHLPGRHVSGPQFLLFYATALALLAGALAWAWRGARPGSAAWRAPMVDVFALAQLAGGHERAIQTALAELVRSGSAVIERAADGAHTAHAVANAHAPAPSARLPAALHQQLVQGGAQSPALLWTQPAAPVRAVLEQAEATLRLRGLLPAQDDAAMGEPRLRAVQTAILALGVLGGLRLLQGVYFAQPVGWLLLLLGVTFVLRMLARQRWRDTTHTTPAGRTLLQRERQALRRTHNLGQDDPQLLPALALLGAVALASHSGLGEFKALLMRNTGSNSGGGGCGAGGSDAGDGGGGGGCGGCGGGGGD